MRGRKRKPRPITCPRCGREVGTYIDKIGTDSTFSCANCKVFLIYCRDDDIIKVIKDDDKTKRVTSSGRRFI